MTNTDRQKLIAGFDRALKSPCLSEEHKERLIRAREALKASVRLTAALQSRASVVLGTETRH